MYLNNNTIFVHVRHVSFVVECISGSSRVELQWQRRLAIVFSAGRRCEVGDAPGCCFVITLRRVLLASTKFNAFCRGLPIMLGAL